MTSNCRLVTRNIVRRGNNLQASFFVMNENQHYHTKTSPEMTISGVIKFQVKICVIETSKNLIFIKFYKIRNDDDLTYTITLASNNLFINNKDFYSYEGAWQLLNEHYGQKYDFNLSVVMGIVQCSSFAALYDDVELLDFELRGEDGCVRVHRAVLAVYSPVLRRMLSGNWRETAEGYVDIPGTSKKTLQHLKNFMYLHTLPDSGLEPILVLASYYMMPGLEQMCVDRLAGALASEHACELLQFAGKHKLTSLMLAVFDCIQNGAVCVKDMREHYMNSNLQCDAEDATSGASAAEAN